MKSVTSEFDRCAFEYKFTGAVWCKRGWQVVVFGVKRERYYEYLYAALEDIQQMLETSPTLGSVMMGKKKIGRVE